MDELVTFLTERGTDGLLPWGAQTAAAARFGLSLGAVEGVALGNGLFPSRYQRNRSIISLADQLCLHRSRIAVIGCGGLGGYVVEELARVGVGCIVAIDPDIFEEHNLNRQILASPRLLGCAKVEAAAARVTEINPAVLVVPVKEAYGIHNARELLSGATVVVDALDSIGCRLDLAESCAEFDIPLVHGAIGGWFGQVATQLPGDCTVQEIYRNWVAGKGIEQQLGNPAFTPAVVASLQVAEVCKIVLGKGELLRHRKLSIDLLAMEMHEIAYDAQALVRAA